MNRAGLATTRFSRISSSAPILYSLASTVENRRLRSSALRANFNERNRDFSPPKNPSELDWCCCVEPQPPAAFLHARCFADPQSSPTGKPDLGGEAPRCNRCSLDARRARRCRCDSFPGCEGIISDDDRSLCSVCSSFWTGLPLESRPDLSTF